MLGGAIGQSGKAHVGSSVVVIGNFDGVHPGHREVLAEAGRRQPHLPLVVVTFWPHPVSVLRPEVGPMLLSSLEARIELLSAAGADRVEVIDFTKEFAAWSPSDFVERVLVPLDPAAVCLLYTSWRSRQARAEVQEAAASGIRPDGGPQHWWQMCIRDRDQGDGDHHR